MTRENVAKKFLEDFGSGNDSRNVSGNPLWRDGAMNQPSPLQSLAEHVATLARHPESVRLAALIADSTTPGARPDLAALVARRDADGRPACRIQERLAQEAPGDPLAALALLTMLRRDLEVVRDRLVHSGPVSPLEAEADALAAAWEVVTRRPPPGRWERSDDIWNLARRVSGVRRGIAHVTEPLSETFDLVAEDDTGAGVLWSGHAPAVLPAAVAAGVLSPRQVVLIASTRIEGQSLKEVARSLGRPYEAARKERRRAEAALRTFLARYDSVPS